MSADKDLPAEVWSQILARLPVKTLIRLRSVNKTLCSIIDDPYFMSVQLKQYHNGINHYDKTQLISFHTMRNDIVFKGCKISLRSYDTLSETCQLFHSRDEGYTFEAGCFGLMLIKRYYPRQLLRLWNPSIRKSIVVPPCPFATSHKLHVVYGLGFSSSTRSFKVVAFQVNSTWNYYGPMSVAVYTVGDDYNLWRIITPDCGIEDVPIRGAKCCGHMLYFQGAVHWTTSDASVRESCNYSTHFMSFDIDSEKVSYVELPDASEENPGYRLIFLLGEAMAYMSVTEYQRRIWVMNKNGSGDLSWTLWFLAANTAKEFSRWHCNLDVFYVVDNGSTSFTNGKRSYDIATSQSRKLVDLSNKDTFTLYTYFESLALCRDGEAFP